MEEIEDFYGVYLLYNINPKYKGRTYIGYTRDTERRIKQHNRGVWAGGAHKTNSKGPWKMVLVVHGFPNNIAALRFEWAWQNPDKTLRLRHVENPKRITRKESEFEYRLRILCEMLKVGPWYRLPLFVRWLEADFCQTLKAEDELPTHIKICQGSITCVNKSKPIISATKETTCDLCNETCPHESTLTCDSCPFKSHINCLAWRFLKGGEYIPISGECPKCNGSLKWGDLIRKLRNVTSS